MDQSTFNHGKSGDTNPKGRSRSPLLELYTRSLRNEREEKIGHRTSAAGGGKLGLCYTLDEGKESERETTNCPPKRVRSRPREAISHLSERHRENPLARVLVRVATITHKFKPRSPALIAKVASFAGNTAALTNSVQICSRGRRT